MGFGAVTPGGPNGQIQVGFGSLHIGLEIGGSATSCGSGVLTLNGKTKAGTNQEVQFNQTALGDRVPLEFHFRYMDGATQVVGAYATSLDGVANCATVNEVVNASGYTTLFCYDLYQADGTIYLGPTADGGADAVLDYFIVYGRKHTGGAPV